MKIVKLNPTTTGKALELALNQLRAGGLVIYPSDTVYGAGVDALNQKAVDKLLTYKSRREGKPLSIAVADKKMAEKYASLNQQALQLYDKFLPGPYTIISKTKNEQDGESLALGAASEFQTIGIRIPQQPLILELVKKLGRPITATSANASGKKRPYTIQDVLNNLSNKQKNLIDLILDAGQLPHNEPSTVIDTTLSTPLTVRGAAPKDYQEAGLSLISRTDEETKAIAGKLMLKYWDELKKQGLVIGLNGELGAGKTTFAKGIGRFLQIDQIITSPTYTYIKEYEFNRHQVKGVLYHIDTWKVDTQAGVKTLNIPQLVKPGRVLAIEWWSQIKDILPEIKPDLIINLKILQNNNRRIQVYEAGSVSVK